MEKKEEGRQRESKTMEADLSSAFMDYAALRVEYATLKMTLSIFSSAAMVLSSSNAAVVAAIKDTVTVLAARILQIAALIQGAVDNVATTIELLKTTPPTEKRQ
jgi:hypothetical protein